MKSTPSPVGDGPVLAHLLAPLGSELFFSRYWGREPLHVERNSPTRYEIVLQLEDVDAFLQSEQLQPAFVNVISNGVAHPVEEWSRIEKLARGEVRVVVPERLFSLYRSGATLIFNQLHRAVPRLSWACSRLAGELGFPVRANAYVTPPGAQGFRRHTDDHEILILQISGEKSFSLFPPDGRSAEICLRAGDLLYIPRGLAHEASTVSVASVHLSMGLYPLYAFDLVAQLAALAKESPAFQKLVPSPGILGAGSRAFKEEFLVRLQELIAITPVERLIESRRAMPGDGQGAGRAGRFIETLRISHVTLDTVVMARTETVSSVVEEGRELRVRCGGGEVVIANFLKSSLERLLDGNQHAVRAIPGFLADEGKVFFVKSLLEIGLLSIVES